MLTGSYAVGETRADSDIDVVLLSELSNRQTTVLKTTTEDLEFTSFGHGTSYPYPSCFYEGLYLGGQLLYDDVVQFGYEVLEKGNRKLPVIVGLPFCILLSPRCCA